MDWARDIYFILYMGLYKFMVLIISGLEVQNELQLTGWHTEHSSTALKVIHAFKILALLHLRITWKFLHCEISESMVSASCKYNMGTGRIALAQCRYKIIIQPKYSSRQWTGVAISYSINIHSALGASRNLIIGFSLQGKYTTIVATRMLVYLAGRIQSLVRSLVFPKLTYVF